MSTPLILGCLWVRALASVASAGGLLLGVIGLVAAGDRAKARLTPLQWAAMGRKTGA